MEEDKESLIFVTGMVIVFIVVFGILIARAFF